MNMLQKIYAPICAVILIAVLSSACGATRTAVSPGSSGASSGANSGAQSAGQATPTQLLPTLAIAGMATPGAAPTENPSKTYTDPQLGVRFSYPSTWQGSAPGRLEGKDGYAWLKIRPNDGAGPGAVCQSEANRGKPGQYGAYPQIIDVQNNTDPAACLILPSADQPAERKSEAVYLFWYPAWLRPNTLLALHADQAHITAIAQSLRLIAAAPEAASAGCEIQSGSTPETQRENGLRVDAYPVAKAASQPSDCDLSQQATAFNDAVANGPAAKRAQQMIARQWSGSSLTGVNAKLSQFGYHLRPYDKYYAIYHNGVTVKTKLNWVGPLTENASKTDFILPVMDSYNSQIYLLRPDGIHDLGDWDILTSDRVFPVFVGDDLITPAYDYDRYQRQVNEPALLNIKKNDQVIDTFSVNQSTADGSPARGLWSWDGHWMLELPGLVIQDGQSLNDGLGYSEIFTWRLLKGKPFYFFRKDGQIHLSFDGQEFPTTFDQVIHKPDCCTSELLQMQLFENGITFYARRGGVWYYVVVEAGA